MPFLRAIEIQKRLKTTGQVLSGIPIMNIAKPQVKKSWIAPTDMSKKAKGTRYECISVHYMRKIIG